MAIVDIERFKAPAREPDLIVHTIHGRHKYMIWLKDTLCESTFLYRTSNFTSDGEASELKMIDGHLMFRHFTVHPWTSFSKNRDDKLNEDNIVKALNNFLSEMEEILIGEEDEGI